MPVLLPSANEIHFEHFWPFLVSWQKQEAQMKVDHPKLRPILAQIQVLHKR